MNTLLRYVYDGFNETKLMVYTYLCFYELSWLKLQNFDEGK